MVGARVEAGRKERVEAGREEQAGGVAMQGRAQVWPQFECLV